MSTPKIVDILSYEYEKDGGHITLKFDNGWITKRKFRNEISGFKKTCCLSGEFIQPNQVCIYVAIKKKGYNRYWLSVEAVNKALVGEFKEDKEDQPEIVLALMNYLQECKGERSVLDEQDRDLREALKIVKFKRSKLGQKMSATNRLLELVSEC